MTTRANLEDPRAVAGCHAKAPCGPDLAADGSSRCSLEKSTTGPDIPAQMILANAAAVPSLWIGRWVAPWLVRMVPGPQPHAQTA